MTSNIRHDVRSSSWRKEMRHDVKNTSWRQKLRHEVKTFVITSTSVSWSQNMLWRQKCVMTSKSSSWLQKFVMTSKTRQKCVMTSPNCPMYAHKVDLLATPWNEEGKGYPQNGCFEGITHRVRGTNSMYIWLTTTHLQWLLCPVYISSRITWTCRTISFWHISCNFLNAVHYFPVTRGLIARGNYLRLNSSTSGHIILHPLNRAAPDLHQPRRL